MTAGDFNGLMIFRGGCLADGLKFGVIDVMPAVQIHKHGVCDGPRTRPRHVREPAPQVHMYGMYDMVADLLSNRNQTATQVYVHCQVALFHQYSLPTYSITH